MIAPVIFAIALIAQAGQSQSNPPLQPPVDPSQMSVAERAAAARKAAAERAHSPERSNSDAPPPLTPEQRGSVRGSRYVNEFFHFHIELANHWEPLSAERIAASRAKAREIEAETGARNGQAGTVLEMEDSSGRNVIVNILPVPPDAPTDPEQLAAAVKGLIFKQLKTARDAGEHTFLGDPGHKFAGFRYAFTVSGEPLVQSKQMILIGGFLIGVTVTGRTDQDVSGTLRSLNSSLAWTSTVP